VETDERRHVERHGVVRRDGHGFSEYGPGGIRPLSRRRRTAFAAATKRLTSGSDESSIGTTVACRVLTLTYLSES
jgi:hypothetical protein